MAVKYVKDFEFPSDKGFSGSAGVQHVKAYARGGHAKKAMGGEVTVNVDPAMPVKGSAAAPVQAATDPVSTDGRDGRRFGPAAAGGALSRAAPPQRVTNQPAPRKAVPTYDNRPLLQRAKGGPAKPVKKSMGGMMGLIPALMSKDKAGDNPFGFGLLGELVASAAGKKPTTPKPDLTASPATAAAAAAAERQRSGMAKGGKVKSKC